MVTLAVLGYIVLCHISSTKVLRACTNTSAVHCLKLSAKYLAICNESHSLLLRPDINDSVLTEAKSGSACNFIVQEFCKKVDRCTLGPTPQEKTHCRKYPPGKAECLTNFKLVG